MNFAKLLITLLGLMSIESSTIIINNDLRYLYKLREWFTLDDKDVYDDMINYYKE